MLAIHLLRLVSTIEGIAALIVARALLRLLLANRPILVLTACAAIAFQPTVLNTFSVAQNDGTVALFILLGIFWCVRFVDRACWQAKTSSLVRPNDTTSLYLFWQRARPLTADLRFHVRAVACDGTPIKRSRAQPLDDLFYLLGGRWPTSRDQIPDEYADWVLTKVSRC